MSEAAKTKKAAKLRYKERIDQMKRKGFSLAEAKEIVNHVVETKEGLQVGMMVQYYDGGLRAGYIADLPMKGQIRIQPIGPKGAEEPRSKYVLLENVKQIEFEIKENTMTAINKKAAELKEVETKRAEEAKEKMAQIRKGQVAAPEAKAAKTAKPLPAAKAPKNPQGTAKAPKAKAVKAAPAKKAAPKPEGTRAVAKDDAEISFVKMGPATGQRAVILEVLKSLGGKATRAKLVSALEKKLDSSQEANIVFSLKKKFLVDNGCIKIS